MNAYEIKEYIVNNNKIRTILEELECHGITSHEKEYRAGIKDRTNLTALSVSKDSTYSRIYIPDMEMTGDIIALVSKLKNLGFKESLRWLHKVLSLDFKMTYTDTKKYDGLAIFRDVSHKKHNRTELKFYGEDQLKNHVRLPYIGFVKEGLYPEMQMKFGVCFDTYSNRVILPWRYWSNGEIIGLVGRTVEEDYKMLGIPKYLATINFPKSASLYGLYENYTLIQQKGFVVIFESEKSVIRATGWGVPSVALGGNDVSDEQIKILISLDVDIIFALDKDIPEETSISRCDKLNKHRRTFYLIDTEGLLTDKEAPVDRGWDVFKRLIVNRKKAKRK